MKYILWSCSLLLLLTYCAPADTPPETVTPAETTMPAEKSEDELAIEAVIQNYFDGWLTGDTTLIGSAMHASCQLKYIRDGQVNIRPRAAYLSGFKPRPKLPNAEGRILAIDIVRTAAAAKVELETEERLFTDYFNLLKEDGRWYITDKVSTNVAKQ